MRADLKRRTTNEDLEAEYLAIIDAYDRAGLPVERVVARLSLLAWRLERGLDVGDVLGAARGIVGAYDLGGLEADVAEMECLVAPGEEAGESVARCRERRGIHGPGRR